MLTSGYSKKMRSNFISIQILCNIQHFENQFSIMVALVSYVKFVSLEITNFCTLCPEKIQNNYCRALAFILLDLSIETHFCLKERSQ